jgi:hypothetical protein
MVNRVTRTLALVSLLALLPGSSADALNVRLSVTPATLTPHTRTAVVVHLRGVCPPSSRSCAGATPVRGSGRRVPLQGLEDRRHADCNLAQHPAGQGPLRTLCQAPGCRGRALAAGHYLLGHDRPQPRWGQTGHPCLCSGGSCRAGLSRLPGCGAHQTHSSLSLGLSHRTARSPPRCLPTPHRSHTSGYLAPPLA